MSTILILKVFGDSKKDFKKTNDTTLRYKLSNQNIIDLVNYVENNQTEELTTKQLIEKFEFDCCPNVVNKRLQENGIRSLSRIKKTILTDEQKAARVSFARNYIQWSTEDWKRVTFVDESYLQNHCNSKSLIKCRSGEQYRPENYSNHQLRRFSVNFVALA